MVDYLSKFKLDGKVAIVVGGLGTIGLECSRALAQAGAHVLMLDIASERGKEVEKEFKDKGYKAEFIEFDITDLKGYNEKFKKLFNLNNRIDILVNAAYPRTKDWGEDLGIMTTDSWLENVEIQMSSTCLIIREVAELMKNNNIKGTIISMGSNYGVVAPDFSVYTEDMKYTSPAAYAAIKGGIINFTRYCASYYGKDGIRVNCISPANIMTTRDKRMANQTLTGNLKNKTPLKRLGTPEDIAPAVLFMASDAATYITGINFLLDGGWTCI